MGDVGESRGWGLARLANAVVGACSCAHGKWFSEYGPSESIYFNFHSGGKTIPFLFVDNIVVCLPPMNAWCSLCGSSRYLLERHQVQFYSALVPRTVKADWKEAPFDLNYFLPWETVGEILIRLFTAALVGECGWVVNHEHWLHIANLNDFGPKVECSPLVIAYYMSLTMKQIR